MLDLGSVAPQVNSMVARLKSAAAERQARLDRALSTLRNQAGRMDELRSKLAASRTTWLVAGLVEGLDGRYVPLPVPDDFAVLATDGSHIDVDRHQTARCFLINIGAVTLRYGSRPDAVLESFPRLYFEDHDLVIPSTGRGERDQLIEGALLGIKRGVDECLGLARLAAGLPAGLPALALVDGSLIQWNLEAYPDFVADALLHRAYLPALDEMLKKEVPVASYISFPRSTDVANVLRIAECPHDAADCDRYCTPDRPRPCDNVAVLDRDIFSNLLSNGERSPVFLSQSKIVARHYGAHRVYFFYIKLDEEVARVEIPEWVATSPARLGLVHSLALDQCGRGQGYPVALAEAHEQAVLTGPDRRQFRELVEAYLAEEKLPSPTSAKSASKRARWV